MLTTQGGCGVLGGQFVVLMIDFEGKLQIFWEVENGKLHCAG
jgi:hypothetical protein